MSVGALNLRVNVDKKILVNSAGNGSQYVLPDFQQGDNVPLVVQMLYADPDGSINTALLVTSPATYSVKIGLYASDGTQLAFQNSFTVSAADGTQTGYLDLSTAAITTALTSVSQITTCILEIEITDSAGNTSTVYQSRTVTLNKSYITGATTGVAPSETAASQSWSLATFVTKADASGDYDVKIWKTPAGNRYRMFVDDDGQIHTDPIT